MPATNETALLKAFLAGHLDPQQFHHRDHVQLSYELLQEHPFSEALFYLARGLRQLAAKAGHPEVYHETITTAFLALIAERRCRERYADFADFAKRNPDLMRKEFLQQVYEPSVLKSQIAREAFILPRFQRSSGCSETSPVES
jgi:hypothetical protein